MRYVALAVDYDGTLATAGEVAPATLQALQRLAATGRRIILVTGRELEDLMTVFPPFEIFDRIVAENGAVLYAPRTRTRRMLGDPPSSALVRELERRGVRPLSVGHAIVATVHPHETVVLDTIRELGLELNVIFNKGAVMILPTSLNKASGLTAAVEELGLSLRNVVAIGDAENDHTLLRAAEYGVAVGNALPTLKDEADRVSAYANGEAVMELIDDLIAHDLRRAPPRAPRRRILLGTRGDGSEVRIPAAGSRVLVAGASGGTRWALLTGMLQRLAAEGYQFCAIDTDGECAGLPDTIVLGSPGRPPAVADVFTALHKPGSNIVVDVEAVPRPARPWFLGELLGGIRELRAGYGRPHWIVVDQLEEMLGNGESGPEYLADPASGAVYVTEDTHRLAPAVLASLDLAIALGSTTVATLRTVAECWGTAPPDPARTTLDGGEALAWWREKEGGGRAERLRIAPIRRRD